MPKVALVQVVYNSRQFIPQVFGAALSQSETDTAFVAVIAGNEDGGKEYIAEHYPEVQIVDPGYNVGFSKGHNLVFDSVDAEFFQLINPDLIISPNFVEEMLRSFAADPKLGAVSGKLLQFDFKTGTPRNTLDTTGVIIRKNGRAFDRGQHEQDSGQYDSQRELMAVSGAGAMYRRTALQDVGIPQSSGRPEYFDEDFYAYQEDVDLSWRMFNAGWRLCYQPRAIAYHGRSVGSNPSGYSGFREFVRHRRAIPLRIRRLNFQNHVFSYVKNARRLHWQFVARELAYDAYLLGFETRVLGALPGLVKKIPAMLRKRRWIKSKWRLDKAEAERLLT